MDKIVTTKTAVQKVMQALAPALESAGNWLGGIIDEGIDTFVDFLTPKQN